MEEPAKTEEPLKPSLESVSNDPQVSPESSTTNAQKEISMIEDASQNATENATHHSKSDAISVDAPKQCESGDCRDAKDNNSPGDASGQSIVASIPSQSGGELGATQIADSSTRMESPSSPQPLEALAAKSLESLKSGPDGATLSSSEPSEIGAGTPAESPKSLEVGTESPRSPPPPSELGSESPQESPKTSTLPSESGIESPSSPFPSESSPESPKSLASNESGESDTQSLESSQSPKSGTSSEFIRRKSRLMDSYSIRRPSKLNQLETQLELVASEREKDVIIKQEYKVQEESLKEKRESIIKQMHKEERKAKMERKASTRAGTSFRVDLNASRRDSRKDDLNRKKEEDERNKQLLLQRARDEKNLRKSIYQSSSKTPSQSSSQNSPTPPENEKD